MVASISGSKLGYRARISRTPSRRNPDDVIVSIVRMPPSRRHRHHELSRERVAVVTRRLAVEPPLEHTLTGGQGWGYGWGYEVRGRCVRAWEVCAWEGRVVGLRTCHGLYTLPRQVRFEASAAPRGWNPVGSQVDTAGDHRVCGGSAVAFRMR